MSTTQTLRRQALALLLGGLCAFAAIAAETVRDETTIVARTAGGALEKVTYEGELAPGEQRALTTAKGNPALLSRTDAGMVLEVAGESFDIPVPSAELADGAAPEGGAGHGRKIVIKHVDKDVVADANGSEEHEVVTVRRVHHDGDGDGDAAAAELLLVDPMDPELALEAAGEGKRVIVMRKLVKEHTVDGPVQ